MIKLWDAAIEYAEHGISINAVAPGAILTDMVIGSFKQINPDDWESASKEFVKDNPAKRLGDPKEVGRLVAFLLSGESPFINGAIIPIDGAQSAKY